MYRDENDDKTGWYIGIALVVLVIIIAWATWPTKHYVSTTTTVTQPAVVAPTGDAIAPTVVPVAPAPVIVQQPSHDGFWTGWFIGNAMRGGDTHTREVHHYNTAPSTTVIHSAPAVAPAARYTPSAPAAPTRGVSVNNTTGSVRSVTVSPVRSTPSYTPSRVTSGSSFRSSGSVRSVSVRAR